MTIYPAIDIYDGKVVRLARGDYAQMTIYNDDPLAVALGFEQAGATAVHIVDLEGARDGKPANFGVIERIASKSKLEIQVGGGIRTKADVCNYMSIDVTRVILGTAAVSEPGFLGEMVESFGNAIAVSADIKDGFVAIKGWTEVSDHDLNGFCRAVEDIQVKTLICTDISKDGLLSGTNMEMYRSLREQVAIALIASGGITTLDEIAALAALGMDGAILGKALYSGNIDLAMALKAATAVC